jgi:hypothetical protein
MTHSLLSLLFLEVASLLKSYSSYDINNEKKKKIQQYNNNNREKTEGDVIIAMGKELNSKPVGRRVRGALKKMYVTLSIKEVRDVE